MVGVEEVEGGGFKRSLLCCSVGDVSLGFFCRPGAFVVGRNRGWS